MSSAIETIHEVSAEQVLQDASVIFNAIHPEDFANLQRRRAGQYRNPEHLLFTVAHHHPLGAGQVGPGQVSTPAPPQALVR